MVGAHRNGAPAYTEALWSEQGTLNGWSTQKWCSCICRSMVVEQGHIKLSETQDSAHAYAEAVWSD